MTRAKISIYIARHLSTRDIIELGGVFCLQLKESDISVENTAL